MPPIKAPITLFSPNNPNALTDPNNDDVQFVNVKPGDHIPGIPANRFKAGVEYAVTDAWKVGGDLNVVGSQYLVHDDTNQSPKVPAYAVLNLHTSYQVTPNIEVFGLINNVLNQHYYLGGTFFQTGGFASANPGVTNLLAYADRSPHLRARNAARGLCRRQSEVLGLGSMRGGRVSTAPDVRMGGV